jgi:DNA-binding transcriptional LysR family regulator
MGSFPVSSEDCLIVRAFRDGASLREAARALACDPSALVRKVQRISAEHDLIQKINGRWAVTAKGMALVRWTEESILSQQAAMNARPRVRITTTTWLSERLVVPRLPELARITRGGYDWLITTPSGGMDEEILGGKCDFALSCFPPLDPAIAYKRVARENWVIVVPGAWKRAVRELSASTAAEFLVAKPFIQHSHLSPDSILGSVQAKQIGSVQLDHLIGVRAAVMSGLGWSCVPRLLVSQELEHGSLETLDFLPTRIEANLFLLWFRERKDLRELAKQICEWVSQGT